MSHADTDYWPQQLQTAIRIALIGSLAVILLGHGRLLEADTGLSFALWGWFLLAAGHIAHIGWQAASPVLEDWLSAEREPGGFLYKAEAPQQSSDLRQPHPETAPEDPAPMPPAPESIPEAGAEAESAPPVAPKAVVEGAPHGRPTVTDCAPVLEPVTKPMIEPTL